MEDKKSMDMQNIPDNTVDDTKAAPEQTAPAKETEAAMPLQYTYRWTYGEQTKFDSKIKRKARRGGALTYACMMTLAFLLSFGALLGVLMTDDFTTAPDVPASAGGGASSDLYAKGNV